MATIVHFEIPSDNIERSREFYSKLFGWEIEKIDGPMEYWMIKTTDSEGKPAVAGGMMPRQNPAQQMTNYIGVPSVELHMKQVEELGGKVVVPKTAVPGCGFFAVCMDTEQNCFGIWEDDKAAKA